jgi:hypothetical protein
MYNNNWIVHTLQSLYKQKDDFVAAAFLARLYM